MLKLLKKYDDDNLQKIKDHKVYVYQMGKVGSIAVLKSLESKGVNTFQEHNFTLNHPDAVGLKRDMGTFLNAKENFSNLKKKIFPCQRLRVFNKTKRIKIITLVREPIARNLSLCFHHFTDFVHDDVSKKIFNAEKSSFDLYNHYLQNKINPYAGIHWYDREFLPTTGVNIFDFPFDRENGCGLIHSGKYDILVLQLEKLDKSMDKICTFLDLQAPIELLQKNVSYKKWYHLLYKEFKGKYLPPPLLVDELYSSKFMKHFYSEADISRFRDNWKRQ